MPGYTLFRPSGTRESKSAFFAAGAGHFRILRSGAALSRWGGGGLEVDDEGAAVGGELASCCSASGSGALLITVPLPSEYFAINVIAGTIKSSCRSYIEVGRVYG